MSVLRLLDDPKARQRMDRSGMEAKIAGLPDQCREAAAIGSAISICKKGFRDIRSILFTGLGGSAIGSDILRSYLAAEAKIPMSVNRHYTLPGYVNASTLVVASSYSGNTEETLSAYADAGKKRARRIVITSGGELARRAERDGVPVVRIPGGLPPRSALGYSFFSNLQLMVKLGVAGNQDRAIDAAILGMERLRDTVIGPSVKAPRNRAKVLARELYGRYPLFYGGQDHIDVVVVRWRGQVAENAKALSSSHVFPEMNHNEIVGWEYPKGVLKHCVAVFLRDRDDHRSVVKRMDITKAILRKEGFPVIEVLSSGSGLLERIFSLVYMGDFVSYYLALLNGVDPTPVDRITYLKTKLAEV